MLEEYCYGLFLLTAWHSARLHGDSQVLLHWFSALQVSLSQVHILLQIILVLVHGNALCNMKSGDSLVLVIYWAAFWDCLNYWLRFVVLLHQKKTSEITLCIWNDSWLKFWLFNITTKAISQLPHTCEQRPCRDLRMSQQKVSSGLGWWCLRRTFQGCVFWCCSC